VEKREYIYFLTELEMKEILSISKTENLEEKSLKIWYWMILENLVREVETRLVLIWMYQLETW